MLIHKSDYSDDLSKLNYSLQSDILDGKIYLITGENGVGKSRFIEGVLLKELKKSNKRILYFGQDIENQILSFNLISLVKSFIDDLKKQGAFFKTVFLNDTSHESIKLDFDEETTLKPDNDAKKRFIIEECGKIDNLDVIIFDEVDKYFLNLNEFQDFINGIKSKNIFIISHLFSGNYSTLKLIKGNKGVNIELTNI